jgi:putative membrane protein
MVEMSLGRLMATAGGLMIALVGATSPLLAQGNVKDDSKFIRDVATDNLLEVRLGDLASTKATNASVKQFGQQMVTDHTAMLNQWRELVKQTGYPFQPGLNKQQQDEFNRLSKLSAVDFDRTFMTAMVQDHQTAISKFQTEGMSAKSTQVQQLVSNNLPILQQHLDLANRVGAQVGSTTTVAVTPTTPNSPTTQGAPGGGVTPGQTSNPGQVNTPGQTSNPGQTTTSGTVTTQTNTSSQNNVKADAKFIQEINQDNVLELRMAQLATDKGQDSEVRQFARQLVADRTRLEGQWKSMASSNGMTLGDGLGPKHQSKVKELQKKSAKDFDKAYMTMVIRNLKDYLDYLQKEGRAAKTSQVRDLVNNDIPVLHNQLATAKRIGGKVGADTSPTPRNVSTK